MTSEIISGRDNNPKLTTVATSSNTQEPQTRTTERAQRDEPDIQATTNQITTTVIFVYKAHFWPL